MDPRRETYIEWFIYFLIGFCVGSTAFCLKMIEENLIKLTVYLASLKMVDESTGEDLAPWKPWLIYAALCGLWSCLGGIMTTYYGPGASGSGVAELIGYLNGINYHHFIGIDTLLTKVVGVALAVSGRLCIGKEGPLCHIGAVWGALVLYIPGLDLKHLQNDETKRIFIAAGASAGVAVAFGSPIGGALFVYELSKPNTFWQFKMIWKVFFSCCICCFTMAIWLGCKNR